jgi:hypothetical protein
MVKQHLFVSRFEKWCHRSEIWRHCVPDVASEILVLTLVRSLRPTMKRASIVSIEGKRVEHQFWRDCGYAALVDDMDGSGAGHSGASCACHPTRKGKILPKKMSSHCLKSIRNPFSATSIENRHGIMIGFFLSNACECSFWVHALQLSGVSISHHASGGKVETMTVAP